ncbi:hypothetical protein FDV58_18060 [Bradyrhizobium elkanii]|uniref:NACHT domain-containing protein n=1 Tax=Bradyrhizobium elkanii TaxID=29448 RepID=A0A4U6S006_BRAEL|nr:hypothetical protein [Bradyrhizobium elkanii]TKV80148.1 hypothetical protein FDV58_18060 [Bradyrhizobium elkanii]
MPLTPDEFSHQSKLKSALQAERSARKLENLAAGLIGRLLGISIAVAKSGFQHGGDAGAVGQQDRRFRLECKKYGDDTSLSDRELLGEIDHALARDEALEAWILIATRKVPEQLGQDLVQKGERLGVPVLVIGWNDHEPAPLAALCAFGPDLVQAEFSEQAAKEARALQVAMGETIATLRRNLQVWSLGFECLRSDARRKLHGIWTSHRVSNAELGQNAAGGAQSKRVRRQTVHDALDAWWRGPAVNDAPAAIIGWDGVGKTWAALDWLTGRMDEQPIVLTVPSSALAGLTSISESTVRRILAERLYELTGAREPEHWLRRLNYLLKRPKDEGPVLTVLLDGLNQEPTVPWLALLKAVQGVAFEGRVRVMLTTRRHHFDDKLSGLRGLVVAAAPVVVDVYDATAGGELDQMLGFENLTQADLHPELVELARTPRLFNLVIRFRDRLVEAGQVTVHRLLWEYGRDTFGDRAGKSFSENDWRAWLSEIAGRYRGGIKEFSLKSLGETASRPDLSEREVYARLSDIIDGRFAKPGPSGTMQLSPTVVAHALGAALLAHLDGYGGTTFAAAEAEVTQWLDPIAGLDQRAEILRAAVSILVERGGPFTTPIGGALVTAWLQTQNVTDGHRRELASLAQSIPGALLDAVEQSDAHAHASARMWAVNALRAIPREDGSQLMAIAARVHTWFSIVSREVDNRPDANADSERRREERYRGRVGIDVSGPLTVLGVTLRLVDRDDGKLQATAPAILDGFPLSKIAPCFEALAVASAVRGHASAWPGLKWLCYLNEVDPELTADVLRGVSEDIRSRVPEAGIHPQLPARAAALLLPLTGLEVDEESAATLDPHIDRRYTYEKDYLPNPSRSFFALERRHAGIALEDKERPLHSRLHRTGELWLDPTFQPPPGFVDELRSAAVAFDVTKLNREMGHTPEEIFFEELQPALARCAPDVLAALLRRKMESFASCPPESRYWSAVHATESFLLAGIAEVSAAQALRLSAQDKDENEDAIATIELLKIELHSIGDAQSQFDRLIAADLKFIPADLDEVMRTPSAADVDALIARYGDAPDKRRRDLVVLLSIHPSDFSDSAWSWLINLIDEPGHELDGVLFRMLTLADAVRFGRHLAAKAWGWSPSAHIWVNHYGTGALIKAESALPFDQLGPRLAPWRLLEAARVRGADPAEVRFAAEIFGHVLAANKIAEPDPGSTLTVDRTQTRFTPTFVSIQPRPDPQERSNPAASFRAALDADAGIKAHERAIETATARIEEARQSGASLYLADIHAIDLDPAIQHASDMIERWVEGWHDISTDFRRRVRLAETAFLALCEALLTREPTRGTGLWRALRMTVTTRYVGPAGVDELLHMVFRVPDSAPVVALREELISLPFCHSDKNLFDLAVAASYNGKAAWIADIAAADRASSLAWRQRRGALLDGLGTDNVLPVPEAWPDGQIRTDSAGLRLEAARLRWREACAHHWWQTYLAAQDVVEAYAAWVLFLRSADPRAWTWMRADIERQNKSDGLFALKLAHMQLNRAGLKRAMDKIFEKSDKKFLDHDIVRGIGPWTNASNAD